MKIISEKTGKQYETVEECIKAEEEFDNKVAEQKAKREALLAERKERAKEVEEAGNRYYELTKAFIKDYGSYHQTLKDIDFPSIFDFFKFF